ncbi:MAG: hypothetical protein CMC35_03650 [Flavobacteriaceae bacterium]|nr:hypothetical protein [Flavobacteriaceae bacterium]
MVGCEEELVVDDVTNGTTRGAVLRTITPSSELLQEVSFDGSDAVFTVELEYQDGFQGDLLESVDYFVSFTDNTEDEGDAAGTGALVDTEVQLGTIAASEFTDGPFGLPRYTLNIDYSTILSALSVNTDQGPIFGGDVFTIRLSLNLTDGRVFSVDNAGSIITGGFFSSPFQYALRVVCPVENDDFFSGPYLLEETTGATDPFGGAYGPHYPPSQPIVIEANGTARTFDYTIYPDSFNFPQVGTIVLNCGKIEFTSDAAEGNALGCTGGANTIQDIHAEPRADYDLDLIDDDVIEFDVLGFGLDDGGCGTGSYGIRLRFTEQ